MMLYVENQKAYSGNPVYKESLTTVSIRNGIVAVFDELYGNNDYGIFKKKAGCYDENLNYIKESANLCGIKGINRLCNLEKIKPEIVEKSEKKVLYFGVYIEQFGHFLVDEINRLYNLEEYSDYYIGYVSDKEMSNQYFDFMLGLGIQPDKLIRITKTTQYKCLVVNQPSMEPCIYYNDKYVDIFKKVTQYYLYSNLVSNLTPVERIYFSRRHFNSAKKKEVGEKRIEDVFKKNDYRVMYIEELTLPETIFYLNTAKQIATFCGSNPHNIMFCFNPDTRWIILEKTSIINKIQVWLDKIKKDIETVHIDIYAKWAAPLAETDNTGPFLVGTTPYLKDFCLNENYLFNENFIKKIIDNIKFLIMAFVKNPAKRKLYAILNKFHIIKLLKKLRR